MADLKTQPHGGDVMKFLQSVDNEQRRKDALKVKEIMENITGEKPILWGPGIVGFGSYHYKYESGREGDWFLTGFSPRKQNLVMYIMTGFEKDQELLAKLGKYKTGKACLYINKLEDIDLDVLREFVERSVEYMRNKYHK